MSQPLARTVLVLLTVCACTVPEPHEGTFVGNPGEARIRVSPTEGLDFTEVELGAATLTASGCEGDDAEPVELDGVDLLAVLEIPEGTWCGLRLETGGPSRLVADADGGGRVEMTLDLLRFDLEAAESEGVDHDASAWVLDLGGEDWTTAASLGVDGGENLVIGTRDPLSGELATALMAGTALYADEDRDGEVGGDERSAGPAFAPTGR